MNVLCENWLRGLINLTSALAVPVNRRTRQTLITLTRPIYIALAPFFWFVNKVLFGWLEIWLQMRSDSSLLYDVRKDFFFLFPGAEIVKERWYRVLPFDYASVCLNHRNVHFCFARGRGELNVSVAPDTHHSTRTHSCTWLPRLIP